MKRHMRVGLPATLVVCLVLSPLSGCSDDSETVADQRVQDSGPADGPLTAAEQTIGDGAQPGADQGGDSYVGQVVASNWISLQPGSFQMGSPPSEPCREEDEQQHQVELTRGYLLAETEVTQQQYASLMGYNPAFHQDCGESCPVEYLSWHEAAAYCNALSRAESRPLCYSCQGAGPEVSCEPDAEHVDDLTACSGYRLPSEAEWEYAARAGSQSAFYNGTISSCMTTDSNAGAIGWYKVNSSGAAHPVAQKEPNSWGLYDMSGNVYEWVQDSYQADLGSGAVTDPLSGEGTDKVFRGGAWYFNAEHMRSARRLHYSPSKRFTYLGFRCARTE